MIFPQIQQCIYHCLIAIVVEGDMRRLIKNDNLQRMRSA